MDVQIVTVIKEKKIGRIGVGVLQKVFPQDPP